jgi:tetratricopeptide (TPR) repeat protein
MQRVLFKKARLFEDLQIVDEKITEVNKVLLIEGYDRLMKELDELADNPTEAKATVNRIMAPYTMDGIQHSVINLEGNGLEKHAIDLLLKAKHVFTSLMGPDDPLVADTEMLLADCYRKNQQMHKIRELLVDAHNIYSKSGKNTSKTVLAMLKLGEHDRDENKFELAISELESASKDAEKAFAGNKFLQFQCLNGYADLLEQIGRKAEADALLKRADAIGPVDQMVK